MENEHEKIKLTKKEMAEIDEKMPEKYGITVSRMMENAGYQIAEFLRNEIAEEQFSFYIGKGNNGGDALAAARRIHLWGSDVEIVLASEELDDIREEELEILKELDVEINIKASENDYPVAVDGLLGYNIQGEPRPPMDEMIREINNHANVVSIDIPSGLDPDTGEESNPNVKPYYTVTLAAPFEGMTEKNSGEVWLADISVPPEIYEEEEIMQNLFKASSLVQLDLE
ncbi:MAG: NAD(P)H-hydrate epimerase [Candidatus Nanohalobium sp.]